MCQHVTRFLSPGIILYIQTSSIKQNVWETTQIIPFRPGLQTAILFVSFIFLDQQKL